MQLPFLDESLEIVLLMQVLEHLPQPWKVLNNVNCVLKPGGWIVGSVSCMEPLHDVSSYFGFIPTRGLSRCWPIADLWTSKFDLVLMLSHSSCVPGSDIFWVLSGENG